MHDPGSPPAPARPSRRRRGWLLLLPLVLGVGGWLLSTWLDRAPADAGPEQDPGLQAGSSAAPPAVPASRGPGAAPRPVAVTPAGPSAAEAALEAERQLWRGRLERARFSLESYRESTRLPPESRPIEEHPDRIHPAAPERKQPLGKDAGDIALTLKQDKIFLVGEESVRFTVGCENRHSGQPLACEVHSALAHEAPHQEAAAQLGAIPLEFNDAGRLGDEVAGDSRWTVTFQPARQGFALVEGTLRVEFRVRAEGRSEGGAFFDVMFTPAPPATFTGRVREVLEQGSLRLYLGLQVRKPGRYVFAGRVDDEAGVPFAYLEFNEELQAGAREVPLLIAGLLVHQKKPDFPLRLRDVEGFLLRERGDPDRELVKPLLGVFHSTGLYPLERFSTAEWSSEERERYLAEFGNDVKEAQAHLDALAGRAAP